jgi:hypothetical protein
MKYDTENNKSRLSIIFLIINMLFLTFLASALMGCVTERRREDAPPELRVASDEDDGVLSIRSGDGCERVLHSVREFLSDQGLTEESENGAAGAVTIKFVRKSILGDETAHTITLTGDEVEARRAAVKTGGKLSFCVWTDPKNKATAESKSTKNEKTDMVGAGTTDKLATPKTTPPRTSSFMILTNN